MRGYAAIGLDNPKHSVNVAQALRAVGLFGAAMIAASGIRYKRSGADTRAEFLDTPLLQVDDLRAVIPYDCVPVAVELVDRAVQLPDYVHPARAFYVFGAEDNTLGNRVLSWCRDVVKIPSDGCLNLAAAVNIVLYDRMVKRREWT